MVCTGLPLDAGGPPGPTGAQGTTGPAGLPGVSVAVAREGAGINGLSGGHEVTGANPGGGVTAPHLYALGPPRLGDKGFLPGAVLRVADAGGVFADSRLVFSATRGLTRGSGGVLLTPRRSPTPAPVPPAWAGILARTAAPRASS